MYLRSCLFENVGPLKRCAFDLGFRPDGSPQPIFLVGANGAGKTIWQSHVVDALIETAKLHFTDVVDPALGNPSPWFKVSGTSNQTVGALFGLAVLNFTHKEKFQIYIDKSGEIDPLTVHTKAPRLPHAFSPHLAVRNAKVLFGLDAADVELLFHHESLIHFPAHRSEVAHWENIYSEKLSPSDRRKGIDKSLSKPIVVARGADDNKRWLMDVILDSMLDFDVQDGQIIAEQNLAHRAALLVGRRNVERILEKILRLPNVRLMAGLRISTPFRLAVASDNRVVLPSLNHLSAGQAILFNLFVTIVRYADHAHVNSSIQLESIKGIVVVDELDAHLDADLQFNVVPELLGLFPQVQFLISTHAPLLLLGMNKRAGAEGFQIREMPSGQAISTERFAEFKRSYDFLKQSKMYEDEIQARLAAGAKPIAFLEGETDPKYIRAAFELLGHSDLLALIDIEWIGDVGKQGPFNTGVNGLNSARSFLIANRPFTTRSVLLLYDCDANKQLEEYDRVTVQSIPVNAENRKIKKGIENLLPAGLFEDSFYRTKELSGDYGEKKSVSEFLKVQFCNYVCNERRVAADFEKFSSIADIFRLFISRSSR